MALVCFVPNCRGSYRDGPKVSVYRFPMDENLWEKWLRNIYHVGFQPKKYSRAIVAINSLEWKSVGALLEAALPKNSVENRQLLEIKQRDEIYRYVNIVKESCCRGYTELVQVFLNSGFPPNCIVSDYSGTMLHYAAYGGHLPLVKLLLNSGANIYLENILLESPLFIAVHQGHLDVVKHFISAGAGINTCNIGLALYKATFFCSNVTEEMLQLLLDLGYDPNINSWPLFGAVCPNSMNIVQKLLDAGVHVNGTVSDIPLHEAAQFSNIPVMQLLLDNGADINAKDDCGYTALHIAVLSTELQSVEFLIEHGILINAVNNGHETPLSLSIENGLFDIYKLLINSGADIDLVLHHRLLHRAIYADAPVEFIECLLEKGANVTTVYYNKTALQYIISYTNYGSDEKLHIVKLLLIYGSNHYVEDRYGNTVLHWACEVGDVELVQYLINYGLNVDAKNSQGKKPYDIAIEMGHTNIVKAIIHYYCNKYTKF